MCLLMWRSEDNLKLSLSYCVVVSRDQDHVIRFAGKHLYVDLSSWSRDFVSWLEYSVATFHLVVCVGVLNQSLKLAVQMLYHWGAHLSLCVAFCLLLTIQVFHCRWYMWQWQVWRSEDRQLGVWVLSYHGFPGSNSSHGVWQAVFTHWAIFLAQLCYLSWPSFRASLRMTFPILYLRPMHS